MIPVPSSFLSASFRGRLSPCERACFVYLLFIFYGFSDELEVYLGIYNGPAFLKQFIVLVTFKFPVNNLIYLTINSSSCH
jgi:hypothetical protein